MTTGLQSRDGEHGQCAWCGNRGRKKMALIAIDERHVECQNCGAVFDRQPAVWTR
jgi:uncharacterized Zn finger protein